MTRLTLTPAPTIDTILDALRRDLSPFAASFTRTHPDMAVAIIGTLTVSVVHDIQPEVGADGEAYGAATVTRCAVSAPGIDLETFYPRSATAGANWLRVKCADYADAIAGART